MSEQLVYHFGGGTADGSGKMKELLGGKGANLAEMARIGLPVPPGFTITTEVCTYYYDNNQTYPEELESLVRRGITRMEELVGYRFGAQDAMPLLVSVRSGARESMPGMMDTILNLGLNDKTVQAMAAATGNDRFAWDCYRRFVQMYGDVVMGVQKDVGEDMEPFEMVIHELKQERYGSNVSDADLSAEDNRELVCRFKSLVKRRTGHAFPADVWEQLWGAIGAVFGSWNNERAITYRQKYNIPSDWGTAVNVQCMVFGNTSDRSGSGVAFTRNPAVGINEFYGEFLMNAQGEDVVAGVRTPAPVQHLEQVMPEAFEELAAFAKRWKTTSAICRISNLPFRMARSTCCKRATESVPASPPSALLVKWSTKDSSTGKLRCVVYPQTRWTRCLPPSSTMLPFRRSSTLPRG